MPRGGTLVGTIRCVDGMRMRRGTHEKHGARGRTGGYVRRKVTLGEVGGMCFFIKEIGKKKLKSHFIIIFKDNKTQKNFSFSKLIQFNFTSPIHYSQTRYLSLSIAKIQSHCFRMSKSRTFKIVLVLA